VTKASIGRPSATDRPTSAIPDPPLVVFDGDCALCAWSVRFITARSRPGTFAFATRTSAEAARALAPHPEATTIDGLLLLAAGRVFTRSDAALCIAARLRPPWPLTGALRIVPAPLRDAVYDVIARNRYRWFGRVRGD
jgi:predicted DCC family thiol-disulfide oxidoreductase YuxK